MKAGEHKRMRIIFASAIILLVSFLIFLTPQIIRFFSNDCALIGRTPYYHARIGDLISSGEFYDPLSFQGRELTYYPMFHAIIAMLSFIFGSGTNASYFIGPLLGAITVLYISFILRENKVNRFLSLIFCLIPVGVYSFGHSNSRAATFLLGVMSLYYLINGSNKSILISIIFSALASFSHPEGFLFLVINFFYLAWNKKSIKPVIYAGILSIIAVAPYYMVLGFPEKNLIHEEYMNNTGSSLNYSGFGEIFMFNNPAAYLDLITPILLLLFLIRKRDAFILVSFVMLLLLAIMAERFGIYLALPVSLAAAMFLNDKRWKLAVILLIVPFTIFSAFSLASQGPDDCYCSAMKYLNENSLSDSTVLADWTEGQWVELVAGRKTVIDGYAEYAPNPDERLLAMKMIYGSSNIEEVKKQIQAFDISYIIYTKPDKRFADIANKKFECGQVKVYGVSQI